MSNIPQHLQDKDGVSEEALPALIAEFTALRDEILKRSEFQQQLTSLALIATGTFLTISLQSSTQAFLLLIYPSLAMFLAAGWAQNDYRIRQLALYIRDCIETKRIGIRWETYTTELRKKGRIRPFLLRGPFAKYSARGIFIGTQIITIVVAACNLSFSIQEVVLLAIDGLVIMITAILLRDWKVG